jgi:tripartite-type tricarboxylate transporter receptor subunit TctC
MRSEKDNQSITRRGLVAMALVGTIAFATPAVTADVYPNRLIKLIVPFPAGNADVEARFLADKVGAIANQKILVENKSGANGNIGAAEAARAAPDGYTLYLATNSTHSANVHLYNQMPFDPVADFAPITRLTRNPLVMVVAKDFRPRTSWSSSRMPRPTRASSATGPATPGASPRLNW